MPNEDPETRNLDKKDLYQMVAHKHYMPPIGSRGCNRDYLIKVYKGRCYRVPLLALKHFEVELTSAMTRRVGIPNNCLLVRKLNILLRSKGEPELGFDDMEPPEEVRFLQQAWLFRVARFADPTNLLEFFETHVVEEKPVMPNSSHIIKVHWGRIKAAKYFFELEEARKDRKLWEAFKMISVELSQLPLSPARQREAPGRPRGRQPQDARGGPVHRRPDLKGGLHIHLHAGPLHPARDDHRRRRDCDQGDQRQDHHQLPAVDLPLLSIRYIYCTDTLLDNMSELTQQITKESLATLDHIRSAAKVPSPSQQTRHSTPKHTPSRMDAEEKR